MTIEFHTAHGKVPEKLVAEIRTEILKLLHINKEIKRAEVTLKEDQEMQSAENKLCEIRLSVYGSDLLANAWKNNFEKSAREVIKELNKLVKQQASQKNEPPEVKTSTVKV